MLTNEQYKAIDKQSRNHPVNIVISREGAGKSSYANHCVSSLRNVIFLCYSNKQAEQQAKRFADAGIATQLVKSKSHKLEELGFDIVTTDTDYGLSAGRIDVKATLALYPPEKQDDVRQMLNEVQPDKFDLSGKYQIVCGTFHQRGQIQGFKSDSWVVVFDDPTKTEVARFVKLPSRFDINKVDPEFKPRKQVVIPGFEPLSFIERPPRLELTYDIHIPIIMTSTEELISLMAKENLSAEMLDYREYQEAGDIKLISSTLVRKDRDYMLSIFAQHVGLELIGDGIPATTHKHISTKGANNLKAVSTLVEVSAPHPGILMELMLEFPQKSQEELRLMHMLDVCHQAIGRNQGNRFEGQVCYLLVEPQNAPRISNQLQYKHHFFKGTDDIFAYLNEQWFKHRQKDYIMQEIQRFTKYPMQLIEAKVPNGKYKVVDLIEQMNMGTTDIGKVVTQLTSNFGDEVNQLIEVLLNKMTMGNPNPI